MVSNEPKVKNEPKRLRRKLTAKENTAHLMQRRAIKDANRAFRDSPEGLAERAALEAKYANKAKAQKNSAGSTSTPTSVEHSSLTIWDELRRELKKVLGDERYARKLTSAERLDLDGYLGLMNPSNLSDTIQIGLYYLDRLKH